MTSFRQSLPRESVGRQLLFRTGNLGNRLRGVMIVIDYRDKRPLYEQITEKLSQLIICGALESNAKLPSVRSLAMELSINPNTIQRAYMQLEQDGYIYTVVGRGNYVTDRSEWQKGYQSVARQELEDALVKAKSSGIPLEEVLAAARICYADESSPQKMAVTVQAENNTTMPYTSAPSAALPDGKTALIPSDAATPTKKNAITPSAAAVQEE